MCLIFLPRRSSPEIEACPRNVMAGCCASQKIDGRVIFTEGLSGNSLSAKAFLFVEFLVSVAELMWSLPYPPLPEGVIIITCPKADK